ncbi:MAG: AAA family ATPase [Candidatus Caenarcaniphilales bacterium]|nr:AAA family ATPase [Candidatus Caenarcaniphilales bacterium]
MNPKELIKILEEKLTESPANQEIKEQLAFLFLAQGNLSKAENLFNAVVQSNPKASNSLWGLAKIHWQQNSFDKAYSYMNLLSSIPDTKLNKEQALVFAKILAQRASFKEASRWLDFAIAQDSSLLQSEIPFLKYIRQNLPTKQNKTKEQKQFNDNIATQDINGSQVKQSHYIVLEISQLIAASSALQGQSGLPIPPQAPSESKQPEREKEDLNQVQKIVTLDQVGGLKKAKQSLIQDLILPIKNPQLCSMYGKSSNPKILLYGPSGCGKTYLCRALASDSEINFLPIKPSDFLDLSFEESELKLYHLIQYARECKPSIIYLDEFIWLSHSKESELSNNESFFFRFNLFNSLLELLNGNFSLNNQIGIVATTNCPWFIDSSYLSTGKIDKHIFINPPSFEEKVDILNIILNSKQSPALKPKNINSNEVIRMLGNNLQTSADIEKLVDSSMSSLLLETVSSVQNNQKKEAKEVTLSTSKLISVGQQMKFHPTSDLWIEEAKFSLKPKREFQHFWSDVKKVIPSPFESMFKKKHFKFK